MIHGDCLRQLLGPCQRPEVGITGALLYYGDDTIQHAGVVLGFGGIAGHAFIGENEEITVISHGSSADRITVRSQRPA